MKYDDILTKLSMSIVTAMRAKPSRDPSHLVAAVGSSSSAVVWTDPGCIDLPTAHGWRLSSSVVNRRAHQQQICFHQACQVERGLDASRRCTWRMCTYTQAELKGQHPTSYGRSATVKGSERKTKHNSHEVDSHVILLQGRGPSEGGLPACRRGVPDRRIGAQVHSYTHRSGRRVATEAVGVSVRGAGRSSRELQEILSSGCASERLIQLISDFREHQAINAGERYHRSSRQTSLSQEKGKGV